MSWPSNPRLEVRPRCTRACASPKEVKRLPVDTPATTGPAQPSKLNKLKDLFVSREEGEFASLITSPTPFLLGFLLYQPARSRFRTRPRHGPAPSSDDHTFPNAAVPCPVCLVESQHSINHLPYETPHGTHLFTYIFLPTELEA